MRLIEIAVRRDDPDMMDYDVEQGRARGTDANEMKDAPYYVAWHAQSWEWYGSGGPEDGDGRYKPKGDGGRITAINVPTYEKARSIADKLDAEYDDGKFEDENVYGKRGDSGYVLDYHGANVSSMGKMDSFDKETITNIHSNFKPADYAAA